jgi:vitamin B12 transporter
MRHLKTLAIATSIITAQNIDLGTIVVSATKSEQKLSDVTSNVVVITKEELEAKHIISVNEALNYAQGVVVTQYGGLGQLSSIFVRGFSSDNVKVLIDGVVVNNTTTPGGSAQIQNLNINDIERIEIVKGAQSGIYGANAAGGVINIITKDASNTKGINASLEYGSYDTKKIHLSLANKIDKVSFYVSGSYLESDGFSASYTDKSKDLDDLEDDSYVSSTINANIKYEITKDDIVEFKYNQVKADAEYDPYLFTPPASFILTDIDGYVTRQDDFIFYSSYTHKYSDNTYSKIYYSKSLFKSEHPQEFYKNEGSNKEFGIDNKVTFKNFEFLFGANRLFMKDEVANKTISSTGVYLTTNAKFNNTVATATIRRDHYNKFKDKTTGKIGLKHTFDNGLSVSSNYATAYKIPSLFAYSTNSSLKPESVKSFDIGFEYKNFSFTYFYNKIEDEFKYDFMTYSYYNSDKTSKIKGFEIGYKGNIGENLLYSLNYTRLMARDENGQQLLRRPSYVINFDLDYYGFENTHFNLNAQYIGKRKDFDPITYASVNTGNFLVLNASADYKINDKFSAYLKINNITDKKYQNVAGYATSGRAVYVGLNAKF